MKGLKDDADVTAAEAGKPILVEPIEVNAGDRNRAGVGALQARHDHQQRRFARSRRPDQADRFAAAYMQVNVLEDMNTGRAAAEREVDAGKRNGRCRRNRGIVHEVRRSRRFRFGAPLIWETGPLVQRIAVALMVACGRDPLALGARPPPIGRSRWWRSAIR